MIVDPLAIGSTTSAAHSNPSRDRNTSRLDVPPSTDMGFWIPSASRGLRKRYGGAIPWYRQCVLIRNIHDADQQSEGALKDQGPLASAPADPCTVTPPSPPMRPPMQPLPPQQQQRHAPPPIQVPPLLVHGGPILQQPPSSLPVSGAGGKRKEPEQPGASSSSSQCLALPGEPFGSPIRSNAPAPHARLHGSDLEPISEENAPLATAAPRQRSNTATTAPCCRCSISSAVGGV